jgi:formylglycine-generating enzyme required for sulfatase activity
MRASMLLRRRTMTIAALAASALPVALLALSGSCSLADLYGGGTGGGADAASEGQGGSGTGTGTGTGGDAGIDAPSCPAEMVSIDVGGGAAYCIDRLEVTNADYKLFLEQTDASAPRLPAGKCDWNTSYAPYIAVDAGDALPVLGVDWCDAYAFCLWKGKHLCGAVGGGSISPEKRDSDSSEWYGACAHRGANTSFPYGFKFKNGECADCDPDAGCDADASPPTSQPAPVGSMPGCQGGYDGIFDMSGNASEWEDSCEDGGVTPDASDEGGMPIPDPRYDVCHHRGGSYLYPHGSYTGDLCMACVSKYCKPASEARRNRPRDTGIRCCLGLGP